MSKVYIALSSLSMDLERVAMGYQRNSNKMAEKFLEEALKRKEELDHLEVKPYVKNLLKKFIKIKSEKQITKKAEDALMYSILFQNASVLR